MWTVDVNWPSTRSEKWKICDVNYQQFDVNCWHQIDVTHQKIISTKFFFSHNTFSPNVFASGHFLDTFFTSYWPHVMSIYLHWDVYFSANTLSFWYADCNRCEQEEYTPTSVHCMFSPVGPWSGLARVILPGMSLAVWYTLQMWASCPLCWDLSRYPRAGILWCHSQLEHGHTTIMVSCSHGSSMYTIGYACPLRGGICMLHA